MDPDPGWFSESRTSMERLTTKVRKPKRWHLKFSKIIHLIEFEKSLFVRGTEPQIRFFWPKPDPHPWIEQKSKHD